jgi:hypothetical protein
MTQVSETLQVVMLPTNETANMALIGVGKKVKLFEHPSHAYALSKTIQPQRLYILSNEEIEVDDWYYDFHNQEVCQSNFTHLPLEFGNCKKIIATTDRQLVIEGKAPSGDIAWRHPLPQPSEEFITHYVEEYNKGNVIDEVQVEYEKWIGKNYVGEFSTDQDFNYKLKINPDNTINIKPKKDSWSREEVIKFAERYARMVQEKEIQLNAYKAIHNYKWIEENL